MPDPNPRVEGAHLVGSVNLENSEAVFRAASECCGHDLVSLPDGETGRRFHWILFQGGVFDATDGLERLGAGPMEVAGFDVRPFGIIEGFDPAGIVFPELGYAKAARQSYEVFERLKREGTTQPSVRFQVSLPTPVATVTTFAAPRFRAALEGPYEAALLRELREIVATVPQDELTIQWDMAMEFALLEEVEQFGGERMHTWFDDPFEGLMARASRLGNTVPAGARLGYHLCYGDVGEKHFMEPVDTSNLTSVANALFDRVERSVDFVHLPVPIERDDDAYFAPLEKLRPQLGTKLYLGLLHREDGVEGALRRIRAAGKVVPEFGVATECGMGRSPRSEIEPLLRLHHEAIEAARRL
ncbi:MAG TPA: hypothetical protein PLG36_00980 [Trueperaceae bacterium]|nr:hypothetical protein [Trueperaceae bacterium]